MRTRIWKRWIGMLAASVMLLVMGACTSEMEIDNGQIPGGALAGNGSVLRFTIGNPGGTKAAVEGGETTPPAQTELQTDRERRVTSLLAVIFKSDGNAQQENDTDPVYKVFDVLKENNITQLVENKEYTLPFSEAGDYRICFVANASTALQNSIKGLVASGDTPAKTVADFKALEETAIYFPDAKKFPASVILMTSDFYSATVDGVSDTALSGVVHLIRAMARIDIVNLAEGITVTGITFNNRATKSRLISDAATTNEKYLATPTAITVPAKGIVGNPAEETEANSFKEQIYTYEQYATGDKAPSLTLTYQGTGAAAQKHTVKLQTVDDKNNEVPLPLKRNNLYRILLYTEDMVMKVKITVADWNEGEDFFVGSEDIFNRANPQVGDFFMSDGTWIPSVTKLSEAQKDQVIGIVAYTFAGNRSSRIGATAHKLLTEKGVTPHGLVLALKNASDKVAWDVTASPKTPELVGTAYTKLSDAYHDTDGYGFYQKIQAKGTDWQTTYPAFGAVATFAAQTKAPEKTTGWYIPSIAEWNDVIGANGIGGENVSMQGTNSAVLQSGSANNIALRAKVYLDKAKKGDGSNVDDLPAVNEYYWSATESDAATVYYWGNYRAYFYIGSVAKSSVAYSKVRCILAF